MTISVAEPMTPADVLVSLLSQLMTLDRSNVTAEQIREILNTALGELS